MIVWEGDHIFSSSGCNLPALLLNLLYMCTWYIRLGAKQQPTMSTSYFYIKFQYGNLLTFGDKRKQSNIPTSGDYVRGCLLPLVSHDVTMWPGGGLVCAMRNEILACDCLLYEYLFENLHLLSPLEWNAHFLGLKKLLLDAYRLPIYREIKEPPCKFGDRLALEVIDQMLQLPS